MTLSIIIPVLNEEENLKVLLPYLKNNASGNVEIIVVDGGSTDASVDVAESEGVNLVHSKKGRARQMNTGAKQASGEVLYFIHADSFPPKGFDRYILDEVKKGNPAGCFQMRFDHNHWWLRLAGWLTKFNWRACRGGDQSQFITKQLFDEIGGYDESYIIYEDNILINELYKRKQFVVIPQWLTTSARRYEEKGIWKLQYHFWAIHLKKKLGTSAVGLHTYYVKHISSHRK
jgi:rSAM/selenodomain-associated transferase 2